MLTTLKLQDWKLNTAVLILAAIGLLGLLSAKAELFWKQLLFFIIGILLFLLIAKIEWRPFINYRGAVLGIYFIIIFLLLITYFFASPVRGVRAWLTFGPFQFQASEFAKIVLIIIFANFFRKKHVSIARVSNILTSFFYFVAPAFLVVIQPDLGSALILFSIWFGFLLVSGIKWSHILVSFLIFAVVGVFMWTSVLKDYQKERILGVFFPNQDTLGINYNVIQSKIAIGSAGFFGKGFNQGTQVQLGFLPEAQTDFIFAAVVEEFGILIGLIIVLAFGYLIFRIIIIGMHSDNNFGKFVCLGSTMFLMVQFVLNIGSNLGITPVIGVPFPFLSYGGSSLLTSFITIGIIQSIKIKR
ncbi:MAG: FtsW/RodA/SpoVE family cell cycle protein [Patescibacteria group bacterium]